MEPPSFVASRDDGGKRESPPPFRFVPLAFVVVLVHTALVLLTPPNPIQGAFAIGAVLATGYCLLSLLLGGTVSLTTPELLAFTVGLSVLAIGGAALLLSFLGLRFGVLVIDSLGLPLGGLAALRVPWTRPSRRDVTAFLAGLIDFRDYSAGEKVIAVALIVAIFAALAAVLVVVYTTTYPEPGSLGLAITGSDGTPASLPTRFFVDRPQELNVSAFGGSVAANLTVVIQLVPTNATANATFHAILWDTPIQLDPYGEARKLIALPPGGSWSETVTINLDTLGSYWLRFLLVDGSSAVAASNQFAITVSA